MVTDNLLHSAEEGNSDEIEWGKYDQHYDWQWTDRPVLIPKSLNVTAGVMIRDWAIGRKLKEIGVKKVLDVGSDTGHFIAVLQYLGIEAVGIDASKEACDFVNSKKQNMCYNLGIQTLITLDVKGYDCLTCMNITHAKWEDENLKKDFIHWIGKNFSYAVLSDATHQDRTWKKLKLVFDFNFLPFYFSPFVSRVANFLKVEKIIEYPGIQKLYKVIK